MIKHFSLSSILMISYIFTFVSLPCHAENANPSFQNQNDLQSLDQEIDSLEKELAKLRRNMLNSEIHAQPYMIDKWHEFAEDVSHAEDKEKEILALKKKIQVLNDKKKLLIKDPPTK